MYLIDSSIPVSFFLATLIFHGSKTSLERACLAKLEKVIFFKQPLKT